MKDQAHRNKYRMRKFINIVEGIQGRDVYHGSTQGVTDIRQRREGMFFTDHRPSAEAYARGHDNEPGELITANLTLHNPLIISAQWIEKFESDNPEAVAAAKQESGSTLSLNDGFEDSEQWARDLVFAEAHHLGHDAVVIPRDLLPEDDLNGDWGYFTSYAVFDPSCIHIIGREPVEAI